MPKYIIERIVPGASSFSPEKLREISQASCDILNKLGSQIQWIHSYVAGDKIYCVYLAPNEDMIREHAKLGGFPANVVTEVSAIVAPATAE